jgi:hypothetical protein
MEQEEEHVLSTAEKVGFVFAVERKIWKKLQK